MSEVKNKKGQMDKKTKVIVTCSIVAVVALVAVAIVCLVFFTINKKELALKKAEQERIKREKQSAKAFEKYIGYIEEKEYDKMYKMIDSKSKESYSEEDFKKYHEEFYGAMKVSEVSVKDVVSKDYSSEEVQSIVIGEDTEADAKDTDTKDDENHMYVTYSIGFNTLAGEVNFENTAEMYKEEEDWLISWDYILLHPEFEQDDKLKISSVEPHRGTIYDRDGNVLAESESEESNVRNYPLGVHAPHVVGYIHRPSEKELTESDKYTSTSLKGKKGIEYAFEDTLRGTMGAKIVIEDSQGEPKKILAKSEAVAGEDLKTTIDSNIQKAIYNQLKDDNACSVAINPYTGEILAMVSTPSYDNNGIYSGKSADTYNRFARKYCPGSTFKSLTAAIGLDSGAFTADEDFGASTTKWQKDSSWGNLYITTQHACSVATLKNGLTQSDNVYFAKAALKIGGSKLKEGLDKIGFNETIPFEMNFDKSQYSNGNGFSSEAMLANSGYGQGEILVNPLHMATIYSAFLNEGNMVKPCFTYENTEYWIEGAFKAQTANTVKDCLINVVSATEGTGHALNNTAGLVIGGKTGTAEIKQSQSDKNGTELGWFIAFTPEVAKEDAVLIVTMIEDVKNRGGSAYAVTKTKGMLEAIY